MFNISARHTFKKIVAEILFWYSIPIVFLYFYTTKFKFPIDAALNHLEILTYLAISVISIKILFFRLFNNTKDALILSSIIYGTLLFILIAYYLLVITSINAWGKVISSELFLSYLLNAKQFCNSIDISFLFVICVLLMMWVLAIVFTYFYHKSDLIIANNTSNSNSAFKNTLPTILIFSLFAFMASKLMNNLLSPDPFSQEPVNLTLYSGKTYLDMRFFLTKLPYEKTLDAKEASIINQYKPNPLANKKNVIIIIVDALSKRQMELYGYSRKNTPYLSELKASKKLAVSTNFRTSCPETSCAISSLLSSRAPHQLPENAFILPQVLKKYDYQTTMILGGDHTNFYGLRKLYGNVDNYYDGSMDKKYFFNDDELVLEKTKQLPQWDGKPHYLQLHLMSAHTLGKRHDNFKKFFPSTSYAGLMMGEPEIKYTNHYDNGVLQADNYIKGLLETLQDKNYLENSIVLITADHGELLGEHGQMTHANGVWEELLNAPLMLMQFSEATSAKIIEKKLIRQIDIGPTILQELSMSIPTSWQGQPVQVSDVSNIAFFRWPPFSGIYDYEDPKFIWKYWLNYNTGEEFIYNISHDQKEQNNLVWDPKLQSMKKIWHEKIISKQSFELPNKIEKN
jgi:glucan phosphoethanolaminetransferase (alkaline phosphatase superfamily)